MVFERIKRWCRAALFHINPVNGTLLTVSFDMLMPVGKIRATHSNVPVLWDKYYPKTLRGLSTNIVLIYQPEVEEYLMAVGAVKIVNTDLAVFIASGGYTDDMTQLKSRLKWLGKDVQVQGIIFPQPSQAVEFKLRYM